MTYNIKTSKAMLNYSSSLFSIHVVYVVFLLRAKLQNTQSQLCKIMYNLLQWLNIYAMNPKPFSYMSLTLDWPLCIFTINEQISQPNFVNKILCICILCAWGFLFNSCKTLQICNFKQAWCWSFHIWCKHA